MAPARLLDRRLKCLGDWSSRSGAGRNISGAHVCLDIGVPTKSLVSLQRTLRCHRRRRRRGIASVCLSKLPRIRYGIKDKEEKENI
jgi:hypothetical protein